MSTWLPMSSPPLCIVWWKHGCPCVAVCLCPSHLIFVPTPCLEYFHASVHEFMSTWLPMSSPPLCIVWWKHGCPCVAVCLCSSHLIFVPTPCLEYFHASVHEFMSTWLPMYAPSPMHSLLETWVPLYGSVFVFQSPHFCSHTLFRMCSCISTCIYVHPTPHVSSTPYTLLHGNLDFPVWQCVCVCVCVCVPVTYHWSHTLIKMCTCISTCIHVHLTYHVCFTFFE